MSTGEANRRPNAEPPRQSEDDEKRDLGGRQFGLKSRRTLVEDRWGTVSRHRALGARRINLNS